MFILQIHNHDDTNSTHGTPDPYIRDLVIQARHGNHDAFEEIVFQFRDNVYTTAWHLTRNTEDALDITQEAFLRAYKALASYKGRSAFSTWLHRIVLNTGIDYIRRENRHRHTSLDSHTQSDDPTNITPSTIPEPATTPTQRETIYQAQLHAHLINALKQLSGRQRKAFILRYFHELTIRETAIVLKSTEGSVKRHLFRAQKRLKELLSDIRLPDNDQ